MDVPASLGRWLREYCNNESQVCCRCLHVRMTPQPHLKTALLCALSLSLLACSHMDTSPGGGTFSQLPPQALIIANGGTGEVQIIDPATLSLVSKLSVMSGMKPHHFGRSPDGKKLLVTATSGDLSAGHNGAGHSGGGTATTMVYQLDIAGKTLRDIFSVDATGHNAAYTRDGKSIVIGMAEHGMVSVRDATTLAEKSSANGLGSPLEVTPTGLDSLLVAESSSGKIAVVTLANRTVTARFDVGATPVAAWPAANGNYFVSSEAAMKIWRLNETNGTIQLDARVLDPGGMPGQVVMSPDGKEIWAAVEDRQVLVVFDAVSHAKLAEIPAGVKPHGLAFHPMGSKLFVTDEGGGKVLVVDVATRVVTAEIITGGAPNGIVWVGN